MSIDYFKLSRQSKLVADTSSKRRNPSFISPLTPATPMREEKTQKNSFLLVRPFLSPMSSFRSPLSSFRSPLSSYRIKNNGSFSVESFSIENTDAAAATTAPKKSQVDINSKAHVRWMKLKQAGAILCCSDLSCSVLLARSALVWCIYLLTNH